MSRLRRRALFGAVVAAGAAALPVWAAAESARDFLGELAGFLSTDYLESFRRRADAEAFLRRFDPGMPDYAALRKRVLDMVAECEVASSVDVLAEETAEDGAVRFRLDWGLELRSRAGITRIERRNARVSLTLRPQKKSWRVTAIEPITLFGPLS